MRIRKAVLSCAMVAVAALVTATSVAGSDVPTSCTTSDGHWQVALTSGPSVVTAGCPSASPCVTATYTVSTLQGTTGPNIVVGLMPASLTTVTGENLSGNQTYTPGVGDPLFCLGCSDVSRAAFKVNPNATVSRYTVWLDASSFNIGLGPVVVKQGSKGASAIQGTCALAVPAVGQAASNPLATFVSDTDEVLGGKCKVHAHTNKQTGVTTVTLTGPVDPGTTTCDITGPIPIGDVQIQVGSDMAGTVELSEGFAFLVGNGTCAYKQYYPTTGPIYRICW
jgi:hypothetical protein